MLPSVQMTQGSYYANRTFHTFKKWMICWEYDNETLS